MSSVHNTAIVRRFIEESWKGKFDVIDELTDPDYVGHDPANPDQIRGPEGVKQFISMYLAAFPDARMTVEVQLAHGELVATRWSCCGTHRGELLGIEPTGKEVSIAGLTISRLADGKVVEDFHRWDTFRLMQQLARLPETAKV
jgi:steroid delta-isomerase-like uncharacterized protein